MTDHAHRQELDPRDWLAEQLGGLDRDAAREAALAIVRHREELEDLEHLRALDPLGADVATRAYLAGRDDVLEVLDELVGPAATALDPRVLIPALRDRLRGTSIDFAPGEDDVMRGPGPDPRAARLVAGAVRAAQAIAESRALIAGRQERAGGGETR